MILPKRRRYHMAPCIRILPQRMILYEQSYREVTRFRDRRFQEVRRKPWTCLKTLKEFYPPLLRLRLRTRIVFQYGLNSVSNITPGFQRIRWFWKKKVSHSGRIL